MVGATEFKDIRMKPLFVDRPFVFPVAVLAGYCNTLSSDITIGFRKSKVVKHILSPCSVNIKVK